VSRASGILVDLRIKVREVLEAVATRGTLFPYAPYRPVQSSTRLIFKSIARLGLLVDAFERSSPRAEHQSRQASQHCQLQVLRRSVRGKERRKRYCRAASAGGAKSVSARSQQAEV
jgi:hypothetical protein